MRTKVLIAVLALAAAAATPSVAPAARPQPHCGDVVTTSVKLTQDLDCSAASAAAALTIGADDVTIDLGGHRLVGRIGLVGVADGGFDGLVLRNGTLTRFSRAVVLQDAGGSRLKALVADGSDVALLLHGAHDATLASVQAHGGDYGLGIEAASDGVRVADSLLVGQTSGAYVDASDGTTIVRTTVSGEDGLSVFDSDHSRIADSHFIGFFDGMRVNGSDNVIARDTILAAQSGFFGRSLVLTGDRNVVRDSSVSDGGFSGNPGFDVVSGTGNVLRRNVLAGPVGWEEPKDGILVEAAALDTLLVENASSGYADDGIEVDAASTTLRSNIANDNGDLGIEAVTGVHGRGNQASGNGNPAQCTGVVCS